MGTIAGNIKREAGVTGLILAGGQGSRMGHADKGLQHFGGKPLIQHVLARLAPQVEKVMISANRNLPQYQQFGVPIWHDDMADYPGPLAGLHAGLTHCDTPYLAMTPCDSPFLLLDMVEKLHEALTDTAAEMAVAVTGVGDHRRRQPVFCLLKTSLLPHLTQFLLQGGRKVDAWQASLHTVEVQFADENAFRNINTQAELTQFEADLR